MVISDGTSAADLAGAAEGPLGQGKRQRGTLLLTSHHPSQTGCFRTHVKHPFGGSILYSLINNPNSPNKVGALNRDAENKT